MIQVEWGYLYTKPLEIDREGLKKMEALNMAASGLWFWLQEGPSGL